MFTKEESFEVSKEINDRIIDVRHGAICLRSILGNGFWEVSIELEGSMHTRGYSRTWEYGRGETQLALAEAKYDQLYKKYCK